jgi:hypothetical protein
MRASGAEARTSRLDAHAANGTAQWSISRASHIMIA